MKQKDSKTRKCGPRVKTGCITCRIRRVKCDEAKPSCLRCTSTGRKCDGYTQAQQKPFDEKAPTEVQSPVELATQPFSHSNGNNMSQAMSMVQAMPFSSPGSWQDRQLFHFYCTQSAFDLSVYLNSSFWYNMILQYSEYHPVVRQAVVALGASHVYAINMNDANAPHDEVIEQYQQAKQYDKAIRWLRNYMETNEQLDPQVILICCALFFSCENGRGNREAALQHLERGLSIINAEQRKKTQKLLDNTPATMSKIPAMPPQRPSPRPAGNVDIDEELLYVFARLDCQATLCQESRIPVLDMNGLAVGSNLNGKFHTITDAQRALDILHNRVARFLTQAAPYREDSQEQLPRRIIEQKQVLQEECTLWKESMDNFVASQPPAIFQLLQYGRPDKPRDDISWSTASQIQLLVLHHRCWWMLFLSSYPQDPTVFTMSPNPRAEEILDICEFLGFSLPIKPSATPYMSEADVSWKLISEVGVAAPLFVLATKCTDSSVRDRALKQLHALRQHRTGIYDKLFLTKVVANAEQALQNGNFDLLATADLPAASLTQSFGINDNPYRSPLSVSDSDVSAFSRSTTLEPSVPIKEPRELMGWGRRSSIT